MYKFTNSKNSCEQFSVLDARIWKYVTIFAILFLFYNKVKIYTTISIYEVSTSQFYFPIFISFFFFTVKWKFYCFIRGICYNIYDKDKKKMYFEKKKKFKLVFKNRFEIQLTFFLWLFVYYNQNKIINENPRFLSKKIFY